ncbi:MAG: methyltransferase domain-containing protein [Acidobacteriota bacterium]
MTPLATIARRLTSRGVRSALRLVAVEAAISRRHRRGVRAARRYQGARGLQIQLGSGGQRKEGWVNVDLFADADVQLDLREPLPFADGSATLVYAEHVLEHFTYPTEARALLSEIWRVLAPGGMIKLVVPDAGRALVAYGASDAEFFAARGVRSYLASESPTPMHIVNYIFRQDGQHKYAYDAETLAQALALGGFTNARQRPFEPAIDSERRRGVNSLYIEGTKPAAGGFESVTGR